MNAGALTLVDRVLPEVPIRQFVLTMPFSLRFPLPFDRELLGQVLRIFTDTVDSNYRKRILRFLQRRGVITLVTAPGDGEVAPPEQTSSRHGSRLGKIPARRSSPGRWRVCARVLPLARPRARVAGWLARAWLRRQPALCPGPFTPIICTRSAGPGRPIAHEVQFRAGTTTWSCAILAESRGK
jgi:hypothetical protein